MRFSGAVQRLPSTGELVVRDGAALCVTESGWCVTVAVLPPPKGFL